MTRHSLVMNELHAGQGLGKLELLVVHVHMKHVEAESAAHGRRFVLKVHLNTKCFATWQVVLALRHFLRSVIEMHVLFRLYGCTNCHEHQLKVTKLCILACADLHVGKTLVTSWQMSSLNHAPRYASIHALEML